MLGIYLHQARSYSLRDVPYLLPNQPINIAEFDRREYCQHKIVYIK